MSDNTSNTLNNEENSLPPRIHINEFLLIHPELGTMQIAGFKACCKKKSWMYTDEWEECLSIYKK